MPTPRLMATLLHAPPSAISILVFNRSSRTLNHRCRVRISPPEPGLNPAGDPRSFGVPLRLLWNLAGWTHLPLTLCPSPWRILWPDL
ncbi:hypothetical protein GOODEAATRI_031931 [Goodea atripinnis]|uniref:Secreted protein n=1 Tax=Goodea atripinnis TaxID=208336 RepID=A0ABV0PIX5_9TELE